MSLRRGQKQMELFPGGWIVRLLLLIANQKVKGMWSLLRAVAESPCKAMVRDAAV